jgi:hypothetical protein
LPMDIERPFREAAMLRLAPAAECLSEPTVVDRDGRHIRPDILCRPLDDRLREFSIAIEVKSYSVAGDDKIGPWIKQAHDYVGAFPSNGWPVIAAGFLWLVGVNYKAGEEERISAMLQLAQHFRVGRAWERPPRQVFMLTFGPSADIYREATGAWVGGWTPKAAELLGASRVFAGTRARLR